LPQLLNYFAKTARSVAQDRAILLEFTPRRQVAMQERREVCVKTEFFNTDIISKGMPKSPLQGSILACSVELCDECGARFDDRSPHPTFIASTSWARYTHLSK